MAQTYLYLNSALYLALAIWGTTAPQRTAMRLGYLTMSDRGRAEYLTTYGVHQEGRRASAKLRSFIEFAVGRLRATLAIQVG